MKKANIISSTQLLCSNCKQEITTCDKCDKWLMFGDYVYCDNENFLQNHYCRICKE